MPEDKTGRRLLFTIQQMHVCLHCLQHTSRGLDSLIVNTKSVQTTGQDGLLQDKDDYIAKHGAGVWPSTGLSSTEPV